MQFSVIFSIWKVGFLPISDVKMCNYQDFCPDTINKTEMSKTHARMNIRLYIEALGLPVDSRCDDNDM